MKRFDFFSAAPLRFATLWPALLVLLLVVIPGALIVRSPADFVERARDLVFDEYQSWSPRPWSADLPVRILAIDEASIAAVGQWPWPRETIAELTDKLAALRPAAIVFDIVFSEADRVSLPAVLRRLPESPERAALEKMLAARGALDNDGLARAFAAAPVVLAQIFVDEGWAAQTVETKTNFVMLGDDATRMARHFSGVTAPLPDLRAAAKGLGGVNFAPGRDLIVRRVPLLYSVGAPGHETLAPGLGVEALRVAQTDSVSAADAMVSPIVKSTGASLELRAGGSPAIVSLRIGDVEIPTEADGQLRVRYSGHRPERFVSAGKLLAGNLPRAEIEGRIIFVGVTASNLGDVRSTPIDGAVPGVEIHAEMIEHAVTGASLKRPDYARGVEASAAFLGAVLAALMAFRFRPAASGIAIVALVSAAGFASWRAFADHGLLFDAMLPGAHWFATWGVATVLVHRRSENERRFVRDAFSRYLAPAVVERLAADPKSLRLGGEAREVTVLFSDARNFTARSEALSPEGVVHFLNALLTPLTGAVLAHQGAIDKYMGDGMMAYWNAPLDTPDHASLACRAALAMIASVPAVDADMQALARKEGAVHTPVVIGVGINTGRAFVGNMGSEQRFDYSMVGDPVNVAARLEAATKQFGVPIIVSEETRAAAKGFCFVPLGRVALKGRSEAPLVHALHGAANADEPDFEAFLRAHEAVLQASEAGGDTDALLATAQSFAQASRYASVYRRLQARGGIVTPQEGKLIGGS